MQQSESLYRQFLKEMDALEGFRMAYAGTYADVSLEREDPDVRRLLEAMAFFTARTRMSSLKNLSATRRRLFQQYFPFLLSPLPAMGLLKFLPTGRFAETTMLPRDTEVMVDPGEGQHAIFRTTADLRILPIRLRGAETLLRPKQGSRLLLHFEAAYPRNDDIGVLSLHINHLSNYHTSLATLSRLQTHLERVHICFEERVTEESEGLPSRATFGPAAADNVDGGEPHPLETVRSVLRFPERHLYLNVFVPPPPRNWRRFSVCFDLDKKWPKTLMLNEEVFNLFVVPITNLSYLPAQPILCDGTHERYAIRHPNTTLGYSLHSVRGVYQIEKQGVKALRPGIFGGDGDSYEIERAEPKSGESRAWLKLNLPEAFATPRKISIEALWIQRWLSEKTAARIALRLRTRVVAGCELELLGEIRGHLDSRIGNDADALLQVLALRGKPVLTLEDLVFLLDRVAGVPNSPFRGSTEYVLGVRVETLPRPREQGGGIKYVYHLQLREFDEGQRPPMRLVLQQLTRLLNVWISKGIVEVRASSGELDEVMTFR
ncbi:type VI secretion system baseplate subunit TssF [Planctomycetota bacterium]